MGAETNHEDAQFLTGSPQRRAILRAVCDDPARPSELCDRVDATRTTVQRILAGFRDREWVVKCDGQYRATITGRRVIEQYETLLDELDRAREFAPLATHLGREQEEIPGSVLTTSDLTVATDSDPLAPLEEFLEWYRGATGEDIRGVSPVATRTTNQVATDLLDAGTRIELVIDGGVLEHASSEHEDAFERALEDDNVSVFLHPEPLSFGLLLRENAFALGAYDEQNNFRALLRSDDPDAYAWAEQKYERVRSRSQPLEQAVSGPE
ncbi:MAG: helix-turn-helix transcriptional regulator [Haloarculaceae archaeon]